ncbi:MAG: hypothetical protein IID44_06310 [Planctomycetes bacterium]|nr:hypothetical protein [Planctomycetota bacterium]
MADTLLRRGFSDAAHFIEKIASDSRRFLHKSSAIGNESVLRSDELATVWNECREANWDGFGAMPVTQETLRNAYILLESLPLGFPAPSISAEPDGDLTLEWHRSARRTLSVSVTADGYLHYAALLGASRVYGTEAFFDEIPDAIRDLVYRVDEA